MARVRAPEFPQNLPWLNGNHPLSLKLLRGRIVLLDFWTYGCINCLHGIPDLQYLEQKYGDRLVVLGVHTAKFAQEQNPESVQQAIQRYGICHPVVVDRDRTLWDQYAVRAWPTFVVIDPQGYVVATISGEGQRPLLDDLIQQLIAEQANNGTLNQEQLRLTLEPSQALLTSPLAFPGKVLADAGDDSLFIADTGHNRIVITSLDGTLKTVIGTGEAGWVDGAWTNARFSAPQGMAYDRQQQILYVADTGNHRLRQINLRQQQVISLAGTGTQNRSLFPQGGQASEIALNSPWDLVQVGEVLYVAMAGSHQIWMMDLLRGTIQTLIGTGAEFCVDGPPDRAAFAQPSGITAIGHHLFIADSESSTIRAVALKPQPTARTVCGSGQLFEFGDRDGVGSDVRLQHCSGIVYADGHLWVADTYNHKIKRIHPTIGECQTICGNGNAGFQDAVGSDAWFAEPSGLTHADRELFVADTNNHAIRRIDLDSLEVTTLEFPTLCSPFACLPIQSSGLYLGEV
ncbi:MAG: thioredoxin-like domain-containing protein [Kovacikia sp.]